MLVAFHHHESAWPAEDIALQRRCAELMMASVSRVTPDAEFVHLTDTDTPALVGRVTRSEPRRDGNRVVVACEQHATLPPDTVILDTDVIVLGDLRELMVPGADLVVTRRSDRKIAGRYMPFLFGVCVSRNPAVWIDLRNRALSMTGDDARWWGIQVALPDMVGRWNIQSVPCEEWNYTPREGENVAGRKALHYKGKRKQMMVREWGMSA